MLRVQEVMQETVRYCNPDTNAASAAEIMWNNNCGCLPVVKDGKHVIGMVTDRDLFIALGRAENHGAKAGAPPPGG